MSTLRETVARVAAEMPNVPAAYPETMREWAADLIAALVADAEAPCRCPPDVLEAWADLYGGDTILDDRCTLCDRKVMVTK